MKEVRIAAWSKSLKTDIMPVSDSIFDISDDTRYIFNESFFNNLTTNAKTKLKTLVDDPANTQLDLYVINSDRAYMLVSIYNAAKQMGINSVKLYSRDSTGVFKPQEIL